MKSRWLLNLLLLLLVAGLALFVYLRPQPAPVAQQASYPVASLEAGKVARVTVQSINKKPVIFEKQQDQWMMVEPYKARANRVAVGKIIALALASSAEKFPADDLSKFGLDHPQLSVKLDNEEFTFGMYNPVGGDQFVAHGNAVFTLPIAYAENASIQPLEMLDKRPFKRDEVIVGFDLSGLEQWESSGLNMDLQADGKWKASTPNAKPDQKEMADWFEGWENFVASSVTPVQVDHTPHPFLIVKLKDGKKIKFIKMQESPQLLLVREDEAMQYHFSQDVGFTALNPPAGFKSE